MLDRPVRILLVQGDPQETSRVRSALDESNHAYELAHVAKLEEGIAHLRASQSDVLLLDFHGSGRSGLEAVRQVHAQVARAPIVVLGSSDSEHLAIEALRQGAQDYVPKSHLDGRCLMRALLHAVQRKQLEMKLRRSLHKAHEELESKVRQRTADMEEALTVLGENVGELSSITEVLREMEKLFWQMAEGMPYVFWIASGDLNRTLYVNSAYEKVWGRSVQSLYQKADSWMEAIHPEDQPRVAAHVRRWIRQANAGRARHATSQFRVIRPDGTTIRVRSRVFALCDESDKLTRVCGLIEELAPRSTLSPLTKMEEGGVEADFTVLSWNVPGMEKIGLGRRDVIHRVLTALLGPAFAAQAASDRVLKANGGHQVLTIPLQRDGRNLHLQVLIEELPDAGGSIVATIQVIEAAAAQKHEELPAASR